MDETGGDSCHFPFFRIEEANWVTVIGDHEDSGLPGFRKASQEEARRVTNGRGKREAPPTVIESSKSRHLSSNKIRLKNSFSSHFLLCRPRESSGKFRGGVTVRK